MRVIIPYSPGGGTDNLVRTLAPVVGASMGHRLVIENKPGGNSYRSAWRAGRIMPVDCYAASRALEADQPGRRAAAT